MSLCYVAIAAPAALQDGNLASPIRCSSSAFSKSVLSDPLLENVHLVDELSDDLSEGGYLGNISPPPP